jgi:hypothetical protein
MGAMGVSMGRARTVGIAVVAPVRGGRGVVAPAVALVYILLWSSAFIATKVGVTHSPLLTLLAARFGVGQRKLVRFVLPKPHGHKPGGGWEGRRYS